ncbi:BON domain-containing protein [Nitrospira sp. MA-1]|nr:BON domain-containing protein [Nitrospira sp. MA-1]
MTNFDMQIINKILMKSTFTISCIIWGHIWAINVTHGYDVPISVPGGTHILRVQNHQTNPSPKKEFSGEDQRKTSANIIESRNLELKLVFMGDPRLFPFDIDCQIQEKTVKLTGSVTLEEEKTLATLLASHLIKEKEIVNLIEVRPSLSATLQAGMDTRLTELVKQRFAKSQTLRDANFEIITIRGMVSLKGQTRFQVIALEAAQAAREIPGVIAVLTQNIRLEAGNE